MFTITELFPNSSLGMSRATAINASGVVVGTDFGAGFIWTPSQPNGIVGTSQSLPSDISPALRPVASATPQAVNSAGMVVGVCRTVDANGVEVDRAFSFVQGGSLVDVGTFVPDPVNPGHFLGNSNARGVNDAGQIVGWAEDANGTRRAFLFDPAIGQLQDLSAVHAGTLPAGIPDPSAANAINNAGMIVGSATFIDAANNAVQQAFVSQVGTITMAGLGTLLPDPLQSGFFGSSDALALNRTGLVVGISEVIPPITQLGVIFSTPNTPLGPNTNHALGVNSGAFLDQVVGHFWPNLGDPTTSGYIFDFTNGMLDLNTQLADQGWRVESATGINDIGQICAVGTHATMGGPHAILLTP